MQNEIRLIQYITNNSASKEIAAKSLMHEYNDLTETEALYIAGKAKDYVVGHLNAVSFSDILKKYKIIH